MNQNPRLAYCIAVAVLFGTISTASGEATTALEEITVTAQKRSENINKVGLQVTALDAHALSDQNITSLADLANRVPSLSYTTSEYNTPIYTLRGVGFYEASIAASPTVSLYMDEVPLPLPALTKHSFFDLQRVEVVKGPQGTLYGQNATGGAINYIANKPTDQLSAGVDLGYGSFNRVTADGYVSGPVTDKLRARLAVRVENGDGWQRSSTRPGDKNGKLDNVMVRFLADYDVTDRFSLKLNLNGWTDKSETQAAQFAVYTPQFVNFIDPSTLVAPLVRDNPRLADWTPGSIHADNKFWQASIRADAQLTDATSLVSITSYNRYKQNQGDDYDGLISLTKDLPEDIGDVKSFTQEVRLSFNAQEHQRYTVGASYEDDKVFQDLLSAWSGTSAAQFFASFGYPVTTVKITTDQTMKSAAAFANGEWDVGKITLKAGLRYTRTERTAKSCESDPSGIPKNTGDFFYDVVFGGAYGAFPLGSSQCFAANNLGETINGVPPGAPGQYANKFTEHNVPFRVGIDWHVNDSVLVYSNIAKGYKAGGYPTSGTSAWVQYKPVTQESLTAYDIGFKASLLDRRLQLNGAIFDYDYKDKQILSRLIDPVFGVLIVLQNIPKSTIKGAELELVASPMEGLTVSASYTYLKAKIDEFTGINGVGIEGNFADTDIPFTPKNQAALSVDYVTPSFGNWTANFGAALNYRSDTISVVGGDENLPPPATPQSGKMLGLTSYALLDLHAGLRSTDRKWKVELWGKNVTNKYYWNNAVQAYDSIGRFAGMPATYGVVLGYSF